VQGQNSQRYNGNNQGFNKNFNANNRNSNQNGNGQQRKPFNNQNGNGQRPFNPQNRPFINGKPNPNYKPGQKVEKGTFLYKIDPAIYDSQRENLVAEQNNLIERLSGLEELFISYNQNKNLVDKKNVVAYTRFESFKTNLEKLIIQTNISYETLKNEENLPVSLRNQKTITQYKMNYDYNQKTVESYKADFLKTINQEKNDLEFIQCACRFTEAYTNSHDGVGDSKRQEMKKLIEHFRSVHDPIEMNIFRSMYNVNLNTVIEYTKDGERVNFLDNY
jgi:hypothetical protein